MDVITAIDNFIESRMYHYALLINGKWGTGKTYFVKETLIPHINESDRDVYYRYLERIKSVT